MDVHLCCSNIFMPQQFFYDFQVCSLFYQMCSERMAEQMGIYSFCYSCFMGYLFQFFGNDTFRELYSGFTFKKLLFRLICYPIFFQFIDKRFG